MMRAGKLCFWKMSQFFSSAEQQTKNGMQKKEKNKEVD
jgi:hypothetical protein